MPTQFHFFEFKAFRMDFTYPDHTGLKVPKKISDNLALGLVLDFKGKWVPIIQLKSAEAAVLKHLEAGEILLGDKWTSIKKSIEAKRNEPAQAEDKEAHSADAQHIFNKKGIPWIVVSCDTGEQHLASDEYLSIIRQTAIED
jgi:hypothetical protein